MSPLTLLAFSRRTFAVTERVSLQVEYLSAHIGQFVETGCPIKQKGITFVFNRSLCANSPRPSIFRWEASAECATFQFCPSVPLAASPVTRHPGRASLLRGPRVTFPAVDSSLLIRIPFLWPDSLTTNVSPKLPSVVSSFIFLSLVPLSYASSASWILIAFHLARFPSIFIPSLTRPFLLFLARLPGL